MRLLRFFGDRLRRSLRPTIESVTALTPSPGQIIFLKYADYLTEAEGEAIRRQLERWAEKHGVKVIVAGPGFEMGVAEKGDA